MNNREAEETYGEEAGDDGARRDPSSAAGRNLEAFLLFELLTGPSYGYNLVQRLKEYGFGSRNAQPSVVYRVLRSLEAGGSIQSTWATQESGPSRRYYALTEGGRDLLDRRLRQLRRTIARAERLLKAHEAFLTAKGAAFAAIGLSWLPW